MFCRFALIGKEPGTLIAEGFNMSVSDKRVKQQVTCLIAVDQLPPAGTFRFEVRPRNSFGKAGAAITEG